MRLSATTWAVALSLWHSSCIGATPVLNKRDAQFSRGQPIDANGKGAPILGELCLFQLIRI